MIPVQKPGVPLLMGLITGLLYYVTGQFTMVILALNKNEAEKIMVEVRQ